MSSTEIKAAILLVILGLYIGRVVMNAIKNLNNYE